MKVSTIHYHVIDKHGKLKGYGYKQFKGDFDNAKNEMLTNTKKYNREHKNYKMVIVGSDSFNVSSNERLKNRYYKVNR